jgi:hypothetical protein
VQVVTVEAETPPTLADTPASRHPDAIRAGMFSALVVLIGLGAAPYAEADFMYRFALLAGSVVKTIGTCVFASGIVGALVAASLRRRVRATVLVCAGSALVGAATIAFACEPDLWGDGWSVPLTGIAVAVGAGVLVPAALLAIRRPLLWVGVALVVAVRGLEIAFALGAFPAGLWISKAAVWIFAWAEGLQVWEFSASSPVTGTSAGAPLALGVPALLLGAAGLVAAARGGQAIRRRAETPADALRPPPSISPRPRRQEPTDVDVVEGGGRRTATSAASVSAGGDHQ